MKNIFVISHASDIDGVGSASLIKMKYNVPTNNIFFIDHSSEALKYTEKGLYKKLGKNPTLFVTDMGLNKHITENFSRIINRVKALGGKVLWLDHHGWSADELNKIAKRCDLAIVGENLLNCATEITSKELGLKDSFSRKFVEIVHYSDFNLNPKDKFSKDMIANYSFGLTYYNTSNSRSRINRRLRHVVDVISRKRFVDPSIIADAQNFKRENGERIRKMCGNIRMPNSKIAIGFANDVQSTHACMSIIKRSKKDIGIYINIRTGRGHIRTMISDSTPLARALGGNGHPHASGFQIKLSKYNNLRKESDRANLVKTIRIMADKLYGNASVP